MSCKTLTEISICDNSIKIATTNYDVTLLVKVGVSVVGVYELSSSGGSIYLTDTEILDFGKINGVYSLQLRYENATIPIEYYDCNGDLAEAESVRLRFNDCQNYNTVLNEVCF